MTELCPNSMTHIWNHLRKTAGVVLVASSIGFVACDKTSTTAGDDSEALFTVEQYLTALRSVALRTNLTLPSDEEIDSLLNASDPKTTYDDLVDKYVDDDKLRSALVDYYRVIFGMGDNEDEPEDDDPALLATYIVMNDRNYSELLTANYKVDSNNVTTVGQDNNSPLAELAGFLTMPSWLEQYAGNGFLFNYVREVANVTECYKYPDTDTAGAWDDDTIATKYTERDGINCHACHQTMNSRRGAWYAYENCTGDGNNCWRDEDSRGDTNNVYGHEEDFDGGPVVEPLTPGVKNEYTDEITSPADYADQIVETDRFKRCTTRRMLTFLLGYPIGSAGQNGTLPFDFDASSRDGDKELLDTWTDRMTNTHGLKVRSFMKDFLKSEDFIARVNFAS